MNCGDWEERIALFAGGDLGPAQASEVERHVAECAGCQMLLSGLRQSLELLRAAHAESVEPGHLAAVRARVLSQIEHQHRPFWRKAWVYAVAAAAVVLWVVARPGVKPRPTVAMVTPQRQAAVAPPIAPPVEAAAARPAPGRRKPAAKAVLPELKPAETVLVKLETDNPDVVIYWIAESKGESK